MYLLVWIFVGVVIGWLVGRSLEGEGYGASMDIVMGAAGAVIGGFAMRSWGFSGIGGTALAAFVAISCAALFTTLTALVNGRRIHTRQL
jgi:uncharacterized membrane protein YeaQ/YmgE (transglycosylase-associated protein family)